MLKAALKIFIPFTLLISADCGYDEILGKVYTWTFPLAVGNKWEYESNAYLDDSLISSCSIFSKITAKETGPGGNEIYEFIDSTNSAASRNYYEKRSDGLYLYASEPGGINALWKKRIDSGSVLKQPPVLLVPFSFMEGDEWAYDTLYDSSSDSATVLKRAFVEEVILNLKVGSFDCYKFKTTGYANETRYHYYAHKIGLVMKEEIIDSMPVTTWTTGPSPVIDSTKYVRSVTKQTLVNFH